MITRASIQSTVTAVLALAFLAVGDAGATPQTVDLGTPVDELDILRGGADSAAAASNQLPVDLTRFNSFTYSDNFIPKRGGAAKALSLPSRESVRAGDQTGEALPADSLANLVDLLQPLNQSLIVFDSESADGTIILEPGIAETEVVDGRQAQMMLDVRHAFLDVYDSLSDVRGALSEARNTLDQLVPVYVANGSTDARIGFDASYAGTGSPGGAAAAKKASNDRPMANGFFRAISNVLIFIRDDYWIVLIVFFTGLLVVQFARRS